MPDGADTARPPPGSAIVTVPNAISLARLISVPLAAWLVIRAAFPAALGLFLLASLSDAIDGWLARRSMPTRLGAILDPLADKLLLTAMYAALAVRHLLPGWLAVLVVLRDVMIMGGVSLMALMGAHVVIAPLRVSKLNTVVQIAFVTLVLLLASLGMDWPGIRLALLAGVTATTILSGAWYVRNALDASPLV